MMKGRGFNKKYLFLFLLIFSPFVFFFSSRVSAKESTSAITSSRCNIFTFDASASYDPENENLDFSWDFGDGQTSPEPIIDHAYEKSGDYTVTLTVSDNSGLECSTAVTKQAIRAVIPPDVEMVSPQEACVDEEISFEVNDERANEKLAYHWNFGDGSTADNVKLINKAFHKGGVYKVVLTAENNAGGHCSTATLEQTLTVNAPPNAEAGEEVIFKCVGDDNDLTVSFDGSQSSDVNNDDLQYFWEFGDGAKEEAAKATHTYAQLGQYDAKLIVKDNTDSSCGTAVDFVTVKLNEAPRAEAGEDVLACPNDEITFDGSDSFSRIKGTLLATWIFGDGEQVKNIKTTHVYNKPGKYQAKLTVENQLNPLCPQSHDTKEVVINSTPHVSIKSVDKACLGAEIHFDASDALDADGDDLEFYWTFGDGSIEQGGPKISHTYEQGGTYNVSVIVDDSKATSCSTATATKTIYINSPPEANAGLNLSCCVDVETEFNASASSDPDGDALDYLWDFGDGTTETDPIVRHSYAKSGNYNVTVTVDDHSQTSCNKSTAGFTAQVNTTPVPVINVR